MTSCGRLLFATSTNFWDSYLLLHLSLIIFQLDKRYDSIIYNLIAFVVIVVGYRHVNKMIVCRIRLIAFAILSNDRSKLSTFKYCRETEGKRRGVLFDEVLSVKKIIIQTINIVLSVCLILLKEKHPLWRKIPALLPCNGKLESQRSHWKLTALSLSLDPLDNVVRKDKEKNL